MDKIELIKDVNRDDQPDYISLLCNEHDLHELALLKDALETAGISLSVYSTSDGKHNLVFGLNDNVEKRTRNAGRKKDYGMDERYKACTVSELKMRLKSMKKCDIIAELGCPKSTFYRIIKKLEDTGFNFDGEDQFYDDMSIWLFTN